MGLLFLNRNDGGKFCVGDDPKGMMMKLLVKKTIAAGHVLTFNEAKNDPEMIEPNSYAYYYGSFAEAAKEAWGIATKHQPELEHSRSSWVLIPNTRVGRPDDADSKHFNLPTKKLSPSEELLKQQARIERKRCRQLAREDARKEREESKRRNLLIWLTNYYKQNGALPTQLDVRRDRSLPTWYMLTKWLGSKADWLALVEEELAKSNKSEN